MCLKYSDLQVDVKIIGVCKNYKYLGVTIGQEGGRRRKRTIMGNDGHIEYLIIDISHFE